MRVEVGLGPILGVCCIREPQRSNRIFNQTVRGTGALNKLPGEPPRKGRYRRQGCRNLTLGERGRFLTWLAVPLPCILAFDLPKKYIYNNLAVCTIPLRGDSPGNLLRVGPLAPGYFKLSL